MLSWIRILIVNPDPGTPLNLDPIRIRINNTACSPSWTSSGTALHVFCLSSFCPLTVCHPYDSCMFMAIVMSCPCPCFHVFKVSKSQPVITHISIPEALHFISFMNCIIKLLYHVYDCLFLVEYEHDCNWNIRGNDNSQWRTQGGCTGCTCIPPSPSVHPPPAMCIPLLPSLKGWLW